MNDNYDLANLRQEHHVACCFQITGGLEACDCPVAWLRAAYVAGWTDGEQESPSKGRESEQEMNRLAIEAYEIWKEDQDVGALSS